MQDQARAETDDVLDLTQIVKPVEKPQSLTSAVVSQLGRAFVGATMTSGKIIGGVGAGLLSGGIFGLLTEGAAHVALTAPVDGGLAFAIGTAFHAPLVHHMFKGPLAERLSGTPNPNGAFTKATKFTAYTAGAIGAFMAFTMITAPDAAPNGSEIRSTPDSSFERRPHPAPKNLIHVMAPRAAQPELAPAHA